MRLSIQRFSMLGLVLMGVSAVTAAVLPSNDKSSTARFDEVGSLTASLDGSVAKQSCTPTADVAQANRCNVTADSGTTADGGSVSNNTTIGDAPAL